MKFGKLFLIVAALVAGLVGRVSATEPDEVRFVILGDSQFANMPVFEPMVYEVNLLKPDFVIQVGDLIQGYKYDKDLIRQEWKHFHKQIAPLTMPYFPVPGNHDVANDSTHEIYKEVWGPDKYHYSFDKGPVHCIVLDSYWPNEYDQIAEWQREWMSKDLADYAEKNGGAGSEELSKRSIFVFLHSPLWRYDHDTPGYQSWLPMHEEFKKYPVRMVTAGHTHEYVWDKIDGIDYVVINSSGGMSSDIDLAGYFFGFIHVDVKGGNDVTASTVAAGSVKSIDKLNPEERALGASLLLPRRTIRFVPPASGAIDQELSIEIPNKLKRPRTYYLFWDIPRGSKVTVEPRDMWLDLAADETATAKFRMTAPEVPASAGEYPSLRLETSEMLRTGAVPRDAEQKILAEREAAKSDPSIIHDNIPLTKLVPFDATWPIYVPLKCSASKKDGDITIDGVVDEAAWQKATPIIDFKIGDGETPEQKTEVRILYDDQYLYVAGVMEEPNPSAMRADAKGKIPLTWADDDFELFFDTSLQQKGFTRLFQNYAGTRFNAKPIGSEEERYAPTQYESAIKVGDDLWSIEMKIPYAEAGAKDAPGAGTQWGFNIWRHRTQTGEAPFWWASPGYSADRLGILEFK